MDVDVPGPGSGPTLATDIFCRVVDNFGDAGVCWRLARRLADDLGWPVRLFIDDLAVLAALEPRLHPQRSAQRLGNIEVLAWAHAEQSACATLVIEAFACDPPAAYITRMVQAVRPPVWINLEYLSAEAWVSGCHMLPSPQSNGLTKYFFFPGFWSHTGGVIHSPTDLARVTAATAHPRDALQRFGVHPEPDALVMLLFCYPAARIEHMLADAASCGRSMHFIVPSGAVADRLISTKSIVHDGRLTLQRIAFCPQSQFDELLAACDLNFVRGEDSVVRAVLAGKPFVWNIYAQEGNAHLNKLQAFLHWWEAGVPVELQSTVRAAHGAWNNHHWPSGTFAQMLQLLPRWGAHAQGVASQIWLCDDLGTQLADFVRDKLNSQSSAAAMQETTATAAL